MPGTRAWCIPGSNGLDLLGDTDVPERTPRACVVLLHGFMGYKDYGFIPLLGAHLAASGVLVHRFNFAHSGVTNQITRFERTDLFARQTWNAQVHDTLCVCVRRSRMADCSARGFRSYSAGTRGAARRRSCVRGDIARDCGCGGW
ncbi:MAG: hypothetical protein KJZ65_06920 [Phycisphaerales bacterium]|nr:hypothetical protein [Phycisphaerales bacterium]